MSDHAVLAPSGAHKWMVCTAAPAMEDGLPDTSSPYADEGTAAHTLGAMALVGKKRTDAYFGRKIQAGDRYFDVDQQMCDDVQWYVDQVMEIAGRYSNVEMLVEQRIPADPAYGFTRYSDPTIPNEGSGTTDVTLLCPQYGNNPERPGAIHVIDLKFGRGIKVFAADNKQGLTYLCNALAEYETLDNYDEFHFWIIQPRVQGGWIDEAVYTRDDLIDHAAAVKVKGHEALQLLARSRNPDEAFVADLEAALAPGEEQCRWCKAKAICPALGHVVADTVFSDFEKWEDVNEDQVNLVSQLDLTLNAQMKAIGMIEDWCTAVRTEMDVRLLRYAHDGTPNPFPDFKLVEGRRGQRKWRDVKVAENEMKMNRLKLRQMYMMVVRSPTQLEDMIAKKYPRKWGKMLGLIEQSDGKPSVAPMTDQRPTWSPPKMMDFVNEDCSDLF